MDLEMLKSFSVSQGAPSIPRPLKQFYKGEPMAMGITQIFTGVLEILFGLVIYMANHHYYDVDFTVPFWTGILYIISGSLSVAAAQKPRIPLVKGALGMNTVSAVAAGLGIVISCFSWIFDRRSGRYFECEYRHNDTKTIQACRESITIPDVTIVNIAAILFALTILEFFVAIISAAFGCAGVCRNTYSETTVVIFQNTAEASAPPLSAP